MKSQLTRSAAALARDLPVGPLEILPLELESFLAPSSGSVIEACLIGPSASEIVVTHVPSIVLADRPIEITFTYIGVPRGAHATSLTTCSIAFHALIAIEARVSVCVLYTVRRSGGDFVARALMHPSSWVDAACMTLLSLTLAERPLLRCCLPATLPVGYNHAPAPAGAVFAAARSRDIPALHVALNAGGSTEEVDEVCRCGK